MIFNSLETFRDGGNLWLQLLLGSAPKMLLDVNEDIVYRAARSLDKQKPNYTRGKTISKIVLLTKNNQ